MRLNFACDKQPSCSQESDKAFYEFKMSANKVPSAFFSNSQTDLSISDWLRAARCMFSSRCVSCWLSVFHRGLLFACMQEERVSRVSLVQPVDQLYHYCFYNNSGQGDLHNVTLYKFEHCMVHLQSKLKKEFFIRQFSVFVTGSGINF